MRIIQVGSYPLTPDCIHGGVEASVYGLTRELASSHTVDVFDVPRIGGEDRVGNGGALNIHRYQNHGSHNKDAVARCADILHDILKLNPDVCHIHGTSTFSKKMYFSLKRYGIPVMLTVHGLLQEEKKQALFRKPSLKHLYQYIVQTYDERQLLNAAPHVIVDTAYVEKKLRSYQLRHLPQIHVVPQGIDAAFFNMNCNPDSNVILSVGAIGPRKGHAYTVDMFNRLCANGVNAKFRIIGAFADKVYYEQLRQKIADSPYCQNISLEVNLPIEELRNAYTSAKLFALHSREESQGIVFAEAMACGLPVVATNVGGIPYVVTHERNGLLCDYSDVEAMADNAERLMTNQSLWEQMSQEAKQASHTYDWKYIVREIVQLYEKCIILAN